MMMPDAVTLSASIGRRRTLSERGVIRSIMSDVMDITIKSSKLKVVPVILTKEESKNYRNLDCFVPRNDGNMA